MRTLTTACLLLSLCLTSCTQQDRTASGTVHTRRETRTTPTADGGAVTLEETWTESADQSTTKTSFDPAIGAALTGAGMIVAKAATGDWTGAIAGAVGLAATVAAGYASAQRAKANAATARAEEHKADAAEGWAAAVRPPAGVA